MGKSLAATGWPTRFTNWRDLRVEDLALDTGEPGRPLPTEALLAEERVDQFVRAGIIPLVSAANRDFAFTPRETTAAGTSLGYQLFLSRMTQVVLWCRDHFPDDLTPSSLQGELRRALSLFWEKTGHPAPEHLDVSARQVEADGGIKIFIELEPARDIVPSGEMARIEFVW